MIRKKKLKKRIKKLRRKVKRHKKKMRREIEQLKLLLEKQYQEYNHSISNIQKQNKALVNSLNQRIMQKKVDKSVLSSILTNLALTINNPKKIQDKQ